jgi:hypothetical protein
MWPENWDCYTCVAKSNDWQAVEEVPTEKLRGFDGEFVNGSEDPVKYDFALSSDWVHLRNFR